MIDMIIQSFIVRIYRLDSEREQMVGTVQTPESDTPLTFHGIDELWDALRTLGQKKANKG